MTAPFTLQQVIGNGSITQVTLNNLDPTKNYQFYVNSVNSDGTSPNSNIVSCGADPVLFSYTYGRTTPGTSGTLTHSVVMTDGSSPELYAWTATLTMLSVIQNFPPNSSQDTPINEPAPIIAPTRITDYDWVWYDPLSGTFYLSDTYTSWFPNGARLSFSVQATRISDQLVLNGVFYAFQGIPSIAIDPSKTFGFAGTGFQPFNQGTFSQGVS
jgi:hypothetical protein